MWFGRRRFTQDVAKSTKHGKRNGPVRCFWISADMFDPTNRKRQKKKLIKKNHVK